MMNQTQKKSHLIRNIAIAAIVIILLFIVVNYIVTYRSSTPTYRSSTPTTFTFSDTINIPPSSFEYLSINVPSSAKDATLSIYFIAQGGSGNDIRCYVMDPTSFVNWENNQQAYFFMYNSGQVTTAKATIILPGPGTYYIVFDNTFSVFSYKIVNYTITLSYYT